MNHLSSCGRFVFVPLPVLRGMWLKTDVCVAFVRCTTCRARKGEPCAGKQGAWYVATHVTRKKAYRALPQRAENKS